MSANQIGSTGASEDRGHEPKLYAECPRCIFEVSPRFAIIVFVSSKRGCEIHISRKLLLDVLGS
jgi:hypothetical protein